jgi:hypothetical protein
VLFFKDLTQVEQQEERERLRIGWRRWARWRRASPTN